MGKQYKSTLLFVILLLLAGCLHLFDRITDHFMNTVCFCAEYLIYAGLILFWMQSVKDRLLPTRAKGYLLAAAPLMLLFVAAQVTKYRIAIVPGMIRYCWYIFYIPTLLIPTLFLITCICLYRGAERQKRVGKEMLLLVPALLLVLGIMTNDLHLLAFIPNEGILHDQPVLPNEGMAGLTGRPNTYTHGILYYAAYAWVGCTMIAGIFFLLAACKKRGSWKKALWPIFFLALIPILLILLNILPKNYRLFEYGQVIIFCLIGVFEACIKNRLIPCNENYPGFFAQMDLPVLITDKKLNEAFHTLSPVRATAEQLRESLAAPVYPAADTRLLGMDILAGYAFREEDESAVHRLNNELQNANTELLQENEVLAREQELLAEQAAVEERSRAYQKAAQEIYPVQKKIAGILEHAQPNTESFRPDIEKALVLTAYVKRKANFVLVEAERETVSAKELASAMEESSHYLRYCGTYAVVNMKAQNPLPCRKAMDVYDCFEAAAEALLGKTANLYICLQDHELLIMADAEKPLELPELPIPMRQSCEDGQLVMKFDLGGDAA
ncbi:MAG: hypothetical protein IKE43_04050 [Coriobacteriales bacterium]|nr:hypothetical protein [Coriobacteriales bacterium]